MSLLAPIDIYCERLSPELLAEPLNALSNISFLLAAWFLHMAYRKSGVHNRHIAILIGIVFTVGIGSLLFHTFANKLTMLADIIPIMVFVFYYLYCALKMLLKLTNSGSVIANAILLVASALTGLLPRELQFNGSVSYFPCLIALLLVALKSRNKILYLANIIFLFSLTFRSIDMVVCPELSIGTHFLWHLLNGLLLYLLVKVLINHCAGERSV